MALYVTLLACGSLTELVFVWQGGGKEGCCCWCLLYQRAEAAAAAAAAHRMLS